jgi:probable HAF family extracellular repeat protein
MPAHWVAGRRAAGLAVIAVTAGTIACIGSESPVAPMSAAPPPASLSSGDLSADWFADYEIVDLGAIAGGDQSAAVAINDRTDVVGTSSTRLNNGRPHGFRWRPRMRTLQDLGTARGVDTSQAIALNEEGDVVGVSGDHVVFWDDGVRLQELGAPHFTPAGINHRDVIIGSQSAGPCSAAAVWTRQVHVRSLAPRLGPCSVGVGINERGQITGFVTQDNALHTFLLDPGKPARLLGEFPGTAWSDPFAINRFGHVVGESTAPDEFGVAFLWTPEHGLQHVGPFRNDGVDRALGMNDHDEVVGWSREAGFFGQCEHPFIWTRGKGMKLLPSLTGFHGDQNCVDGTMAFAINNSGEIVGESNVRRGSTTLHAVLWRPRHPLSLVR